MDETEDNISPAVRELMAKYVAFTKLHDGHFLNLIIGSTAPSQIMNGSMLALRNQRVPKFTMPPVPIPS